MGHSSKRRHSVPAKFAIGSLFAATANRFATVVGAAKAASILGISVVLSTINPKSNGEFIPEIGTLFPGQEAISRKILGFDAFEDDVVWKAVKNTGCP